MLKRLPAVAVACLLAAWPGAGSRAQTAEPSPFDAIAPVVSAAIARHDLPGAVVLVGRGDTVLYHAALGDRAVEPAREPMTEDTIFDLASLTKVVATTPSVMQLVEQGRLRLADPIGPLIKEFAAGGKGAITIRELLTHTSGLAPDLPLEVEFHGEEEAIRHAAAQAVVAAPGERFVYSDINFFLLGAIVERVTGERIDRYAAAHVFAPLGMTETRFLPPASWRPRIAPTERCLPLAWPCGQAGATFLRGVVHDPTARRMDGVAGHAGLFSTAHDLALYCRMLLGRGRLGAVRVLSPASVARMTSAATPPGMADVRGLGWDLDSRYASNRGDLFPPGASFGHTGFTGTSIWIDPASDSYVIFLSNRVHPDGKGDVTPLRGEVANIAAAAISTIEAPAAMPAAARAERAADARHQPTLAGIDVLEAEHYAPIAGKRVGLLTNRTGRARSGATTIDLLAHAPGVTLVALFSPEHGIRGEMDAPVASSKDDKTGLPIYSLYGATQRPTAAMLAGLDALVVDLQDVGVRFYSYPVAVAYVLEEAAKRRLPVFVLDRPDPIGGVAVEGPEQDKAPSYTGYVKMPIRHGMTIGELARLFNDEAEINADLTVVPVRNWRRDEWFDATGLAWVDPSPNIRNLNEATLYPGVGAIEGANISVGRGTNTPFEQIGAPWIDGEALADALNARGLPGIRFYPVSFTPSADAKLGGQPCRGVFMVVTDRDRLQPVRVGLEIAAALARLNGPRFELERAATLLGAAAVARIRAGEDPAAIAASWAADEARWRTRRAKYLLY